jgi:Bacterial SH3 domain
MKRVLLSLLVIGAIFYPAYTYFAANDEPKSAGRIAAPGQATVRASPAVEGIGEAQAAEEPGGADPAAPNSAHAITVEQAPAQATAEAPSQAPAQAQAPAPSPPTPEATQPPPGASAEASPDAKPDHPAFMKVTSPTSIREGPSVSSAIIGIAHLGAEAQVVSRDSDWVQIIDPGSKKTGWINQSFLEPQAEPSSQPASKEEIDAALAAPAPSRSNSASADRPAYAKSRAHKHSWNHKRHRRGFALGFFRRRFW